MIRPKIVTPDGFTHVYCARCDQIVPIKGTHNCIGGATVEMRKKETHEMATGIRTVDGKSGFDFGGQ